MKFALVTAHNDAYQPLADITWEQNKKLYAERHGYDAIAKTTFKYPVNTSISFERSELIIELLESGKYDWIHACGCDTMITNFNIKLEDIVDNDYDFVIAVDCYNINNDSMLIRNAPSSIAWLKYIVSSREQYINHPTRWFDQQCMIESIDMMGDRIKVVTQRTLNSYNYDLYPIEPHIYKKDLMGNSGQWEPGDFLIHWPAIPNDQRIIMAQDMLTKVVK
jgi:galactosyl transferase GMA12/MNN10 family